ncbi:hypothetical protein HHK36_019562 [Tetracentron sinense]|uniref:Pentatricopeptide repeat-containing protein n=1 Tax=Tetracentron sinense TaxID=13715 RepID=A0A835DCE2_TETSI|nr:hypothetical protein HHK36_019562 [Tetracentron sinense]
MLKRVPSTAGKCAINATNAGGITFKISSSVFVVPPLTNATPGVDTTELETAGSPGAVALGSNPVPTGKNEHRIRRVTEDMGKVIGPVEDADLKGQVIGIHLQITKNGFVSNFFLSNSLITVYVRTGNLVDAHKVFDKMAERNVGTWTCLIFGYANHDMSNKACALFCSMIYAGFFPTHHALGSALYTCQDSRPGLLIFRMQIHGLISKTQYSSDVVCNAELFCGFFGLCSTGVGWDTYKKFSILEFYSFNLFSKRRCSLCLREDLGFTFKPNEYTVGSLITATCSSSIDFSVCLLQQMCVSVEKSGFLRYLCVVSALVSGFTEYGFLDNVKKIFDQMGREE